MWIVSCRDNLSSLARALGRDAQINAVSDWLIMECPVLGHSRTPTRWSHRDVKVETGVFIFPCFPEEASGLGHALALPGPGLGEVGERQQPVNHCFVSSTHLCHRHTARQTNRPGVCASVQVGTRCARFKAAMQRKIKAEIPCGGAYTPTTSGDAPTMSGPASPAVQTRGQIGRASLGKECRL